MKRDAEQLRDGTTLDADLCIIGGGPGGMTLARELVGLPARVIWLESGGLQAEESAQILNEGAFIGAPYAGLRQTRHRQLGGTTRTWNTRLNGELGAKYVPLDPCDFEPRSGIEPNGWPFRHEHLQLFYERAQVVCGLGPFEYDGSHWCDERKTFALPDPRIRRSVYQFGPASAWSETSLREVVASENVGLFYHATACALKMHGNQRSVASVEAATLAGNRFRVNAAKIVLAAGAIENARLLLVSREPGQGAPGNEHDWVGRCFMEHPRDRALSLIPARSDIYAEAAFYDRHTAPDGTLIGGRIALDSRTIVEERLVNGSVTLLPLMRERRGVRLFGSLAARMMGRSKSKASAGYGWSLAPRSDRIFQGFQLLLNTEQLPHPDNRVLLSRATDQLGVPKPEVHWRWRTQDQSRLERLRTIVAEAIEAAGIGQVETSMDCSPDPNAHHHAGTTRMHEEPRLGVVDADSRVHGTDNLYITGSSVFPTAGFANPTLTIVALALRLADHLKQRL
jgi:choline dehydrogenase-like flavoprotein